ncbi:PREDICTED: discoidin domain-containing receptor 2-like [Priapulus caudatus]|uniref:Discoidin domain-containing receptor 2-like n=1 Tax=Priapulus caudatus TaxID=37621 RepID=A0ABM1ETJ6_PRICU|nr:PREDICTED: discoidin domain-containing receptor 2-like [Priapulus caudatus]
MAPALPPRYPNPRIRHMKPSEALSLHYAETELFRVQKIQSASGSNIYAAPPDLLASRNSRVTEFPIEDLAFLEKLGEGQFGEVHVCETAAMSDLDYSPGHTSDNGKSLVVIKILGSDATQDVRQDFLKEARILSRLKDANIVRVLGVCSRVDPVCIVMEYMKNGDLNQFLQQYELEESFSNSSGSLPWLNHLAPSGEAGKQESMDAGKQEEVGKQGCRKAGKQESRKAGKQESREAGKQGSRKAGKQGEAGSQPATQ